VAILRTGAFQRAAFEDDVDARFVKLALPLDVTQTFFDETVRQSGNPWHFSIIWPCDSSSSSDPVRKLAGP